MRILVVGGSGFIGRRLVASLMPLHDVSVMDINKPPVTIRFYQGSANAMNDVTKTFEEARPDVVVDLSGKVDFRWSMANPSVDLVTHTMGSLNLLEACKGKNIHFILASSSAVFGLPYLTPTPEECLPRPQSPYGVSKYAAEMYCDLYTRVHGVKTTVARFTNVYGPGSDHGAVRIFMNRLSKGEPITLFGGEQKIQWLYVEDAVSFLKFVTTRGISGVYNVGGPEVVTLKDLLYEIMALIGNTDFDIKPPVLGDIPVTEFDLTKVRSTGWTPAVSVKDGLRETYDWYKKEVMNS